MDERMTALTMNALELVTTYGLQVVGAIAVLVVGRIAAGAVRRGVHRSLERAGTDATLVPFLSNGVYYLLLAAVIIAVLNLFGVQTTSLVAVMGAAGLAVGMALQGTLANFAAGVMLLVFRPIRTGDYVEVAGVAGTVGEISVFTTALDTPDNVHITVPNGSIFGTTIKNYSRNAQRRNDIVVGISYDDDIGKAIETIQGVLREDARVLADPAPVVAVIEMADSSVNITVRPWCAKEDYWALRFDLMRALKERLEAAGCSIPYPQRDLHVIPPAAR
ncbi:MAG: mechanosensitive ion channel [Myxococcota bacterium]|nr:mechanosensitive ion channel [Myxococcales bacterium]